MAEERSKELCDKTFRAFRGGFEENWGWSTKIGVRQEEKRRIVEGNTKGKRREGCIKGEVVVGAETEVEKGKVISV